MFPLQASRLEVHLKQQTEELDRIRREKKEEIGKLLEQIRKLRESYEVKMREYQELFDLKIKLDKEIEKYRKLLEGEEHRCVCRYVHACIYLCLCLQ